MVSRCTLLLAVIAIWPATGAARQADARREAYTKALGVEPEIDYVVPADVLSSGTPLLNKDPSTTAPFASATLLVSLSLE